MNTKRNLTVIIPWVLALGYVTGYMALKSKAFLESRVEKTRVIACESSHSLGLASYIVEKDWSLCELLHGDDHFIDKDCDGSVDKIENRDKAKEMGHKEPVFYERPDPLVCGLRRSEGCGNTERFIEADKEYLSVLEQYRLREKAQELLRRR